MADTIFFGGDILTIDGSIWQQEAVAVKDGRVIDVGNVDDITKLVITSTEMVDLEGCTMLPGFIEPHTHSAPTGLSRFGSVEIAGFQHTTKEEAWIEVTEAAKNTPEGKWLCVTGLNPMLVPGMTAPRKEQLDKISQRVPIMVSSQSGHSAYVNSMALHLAGIDDTTPDPVGGRFVRDEVTNQLTGEVRELSAIGMIIKCANFVNDDEEGVKFIKQALNSYAEAGCTTIGDMGNIEGFTRSIPLYMNTSSLPGCPVRVVMYNTDQNMIKYSDFKKGVIGVDSPCAVGIKWWADGSPYNGTMACQDPYLDSNLTREGLAFDAPPSTGMLIQTRQALYDSMLSYHRNGWQLATHAQGERAIAQTLDVYTQLLREYPREDHRYRIEHCGLITTEQIEQARQLGVSLSFFCDHIHYFGRYLRDDILGQERASRFMPMGSAIRAGHEPTFHADSPCTPTDIMRTMKTAVTRQTRREPSSEQNISGLEPQVIGQNEAVPVDEAIKACTINAAYQLFHETVIGSIERGKLADFTILSANPRNVDPYDLDDIDIVSTYRQGEKVKLLQIV